MTPAEEEFFKKAQQEQEQTLLAVKMNTRKAENARRTAEQEEMEERRRQFSHARELRIMAERAVPYHERIGAIDTHWISTAQVIFALMIPVGFFVWIGFLLKFMYVWDLTLNSQGTVDWVQNIWPTTIKVTIALLAFMLFVGVPAGLYSVCKAVTRIVAALSVPYDPPSMTPDA